MSLIYGPNTRLVVAFLALLRTLTDAQKGAAIFADPARRNRCSAEHVQWSAAWGELQDGLRRTSRMTATGPAWRAVWDAVNGEGHDPTARSPLSITARNTVEALIGWDLVTAEQRRVLWAPFAGICPDPTHVGAAA